MRSLFVVRVAPRARVGRAARVSNVSMPRGCLCQAEWEPCRIVAAGPDVLCRPSVLPGVEKASGPCACLTALGTTRALLEALGEV